MNTTTTSTLSRFVTDKSTPAVDYINSLQAANRLEKSTANARADQLQGEIRPGLLKTGALVAVAFAGASAGAVAAGSPSIAVGVATGFLISIANAGIPKALYGDLKASYIRSQICDETTFTLVKDDLRTRQSALGLWESIMVKLGQRDQIIERQAHLIVGQAQQERDADPHQTIRNFVPVGLSNERQTPAQPSILDLAELEHESGRHERQRG